MPNRRSCGASNPSKRSKTTACGINSWIVSCSRTMRNRRSSINSSKRIRCKRRRSRSSARMLKLLALKLKEGTIKPTISKACWRWKRRRKGSRLTRRRQRRRRTTCSTTSRIKLNLYRRVPNRQVMPRNWGGACAASSAVATSRRSRKQRTLKNGRCFQPR